jgi:hypothetical protein
MACSLTATQKAKQVVRTVGRALGVTGVQPVTRLGVDLGLSRQARRLLFFPVRNDLMAVNCPPKASFTPAVVSQCTAVGDIASKT